MALVKAIFDVFEGGSLSEILARRGVVVSLAVIMVVR